jgi:ADP-ribosyl-[dinitrogen reductase] hydrolase
MAHTYPEAGSSATADALADTLRGIRTSATHPLRIAELDLGAELGRIGVTFAPGKKQADAMSGVWHRDLTTDVDTIARWNAAAVITLVEPHELNELQIEHLGEEVKRHHMEWHHWPIEDVSAPGPLFEAGWADNSRRLIALLKVGSNVLVHCKGGLGRAGTVAARLLVEMGVEPGEAVDKVRAVRPGAIETKGQEGWILAGQQAPTFTPPRTLEAVRNRAIGSLVGLAVGDAFGTTLEFTDKPKFVKLEEMVGGGPFRLKAGEWTDDTAMALALAESLQAHADLDPDDLMNRFWDWYENGTYSCTGTCFDIGMTVSSALGRFKSTGEPLAGSTDPRSAGNGALMRLAPVAIRHWGDLERLKTVASLQTRTTHGALETVDASVVFAEMLADAIAGHPVEEVLRPRTKSFVGKIDEIAKGSWKGRHRDTIRGSGYVVHSLEAALWAVSRTTSFRSAIQLAANLGEDADTTAAVAGQLAGALYGLSGIPEEWLSHLAWRERIIRTAEDLFSSGFQRTNAL